MGTSLSRAAGAAVDEGNVDEWVVPKNLAKLMVLDSVVESIHQSQDTEVGVL